MRTVSDRLGNMHFTAWGGYDKGKPRVRLLLETLAQHGLLGAEINIDIWRGIEDKSVAGLWRVLSALLTLLISYPVALYRLAKSPRSNVILLLYPAVLDIFIAWPLARLRRQKIVFDAFIPLYDTVVNDRGMLNQAGLPARLIWHVERLALRLADLIVVDTDPHAHYFAMAYGLPSEKFVTILVGAEATFWEARNGKPERGVAADIPSPYVLFYGQLIPLHGMRTILKAIELCASHDIHWLIVGKGQEEAIVRDFADHHVGQNMTWLPWVEYAELPTVIRNASVCLGIFGASDKAGRVIPNKMFQILAAGSSIITRDSPAVAQIADEYPETIKLVPADDADALCEAVIEAWQADPRPPLPLAAQSQLSPTAGIRKLIDKLLSEDH